MMRSLWTSASGMNSQQMNIDVISNNLANVTTTGYKKERLEFKDLFYQTIEKARGTEESNNPRPTSLQIGHGVRAAATVRDYSTGNIEQTGNKLNFAIEGEGFFKVKKIAGDTSNTPNSLAYTRDGSFKMVTSEDGVRYLTTSQGYTVLNEDDIALEIPNEIDVSTLSVDQNGGFYYINDQNEKTPLNQKLKIVQFYNRNGLERIGDNLSKITTASGKPISETEVDVSKKSRVLQGYLERSNVQIVEEMVNLITAQRAYEINSKAIQASDEMLSQANQLKR